MKMITTYWVLLFAGIILLLSSCNENEMVRFNYADGSGNSYSISHDTLIYSPVTAENSSSGIYSGGEPATKLISKSNSAELIMLFENAWKNESIHLKNREMGSGQIARIQGEQKETRILKRGSVEMVSIESKLKSLLDLK